MDEDTGINYQGSYELKFLTKLKNLNGVEWVKHNVTRGPSIRYKDVHGYNRWYLSDYIIGNTIYEIKSNWTWNRRGNDKLLEQNNINKLNSAKDAGYSVVLVREGIEINYAT